MPTNFAFLPDGGFEAGAEKVRYDIRDELPASERGKIPDAENPWQDCDCYRDLPLDETHGPYPVVVFVHGTAAFRHQSLPIVTHWASRGFVVLALDHAYEAPVVELADGRLATPVVRFLPDDPDRLRYMGARQAVRAADLRFVAGRVGEPGAFGPRLSQRLDPRRIAAIGHSFGGASAVEAAMEDARIRAVANIDGTLYGHAATGALPRPVTSVLPSRASRS